MSDTHERIDKKEPAELRRRAALYEEQKQWEPLAGCFSLYGDGQIIESNYPDYNDFGMEFASMDQAEEAKPLIRAHNRLIRYVQEHGGIQEFERDKYNWSVDLSDGKVIFTKIIVRVGTIYMTKSCAESLADGLKDGSILL